MSESDLVAALRPVVEALEAEASERQWWDIVGVLRVTSGADHEYLRRWAVPLGVADLLERALAQARE